MNGPTIAELARITDPLLRRLIGAIRRMTVTVTSKTLWQLSGYQVDKVETLPAEPFTGIGFYSRPPASGKPEAIAVFAGGAKSPAIVATRDEDTRKAVAGGIAADETIVFSSAAVVYVRANGTVEVRTPSGTALPLATKADLDALKAAINGWTPAPNDGGAALKTALTALFTGPPTWPAGTTVLKGQ